MKKMSKIVNYFLGRPEATPFLEPVDWRLLELYDYLQVIETPMDLGTIRRKLDRSLTALNKESTSTSTSNSSTNLYTTPQQVAHDVRLVWHNCMTYNETQSEFWNLAKSLSKKFETKYQKVKDEFNLVETDNTPDPDGEGDVSGLESDKEFEFDEDTTSRSKKRKKASNNNNNKRVRKPRRKGERVRYDGGGDSTDDDQEEELDERQDMEEDEGMDSDAGNKGLSNSEAGDDDEEEDEEEEDDDASSGVSHSRSSAGSRRSRVSVAPLDVKARFAANLLSLSGIELGYVITTLERKAPHVLEDLNYHTATANNNNGGYSGDHLDPFHSKYASSSIEINVDKLDPTLLNELAKYAQERAAQRKKVLSMAANAAMNHSQSAQNLTNVNNKYRKKKK